MQKKKKDKKPKTYGRKVGKESIREMGRVDNWLKIPKVRIGTNLLAGNKVVVSWGDYKKIRKIYGAHNNQVILYPYCKGPYVILTSK